MRALCLLFAALALSACHSESSADATQRAAAPATSSRTTTAGVRLDASQLQQVHVEALAPRTADDAIRTTGVIEFNGDRMARILPPVSGQVQDLAVNVGDSVAKDATLFVLSSREVAAAVADHQASHRDLEMAEKTYAMTQDLFDHQAASHIAQQQAENELAKARAKVQQTEEVLRVLGLDGRLEDNNGQIPPRIPVRSPIEGTVTDRVVTTGQFVGPDNPPLMTVADLSSVWVQADVFERDLHNIAVGQKADVTTTAYPDEHFIAKVARIGNVVDPQTRTAKVRIQVANRDSRLKPGMFAMVSLALPEAPTALAVPMRSVFFEGGASYAYVQAAANVPEFVRRTVQTTPVPGTDRLRVLSGLSPGDRVVSDGVLLLRQVESEGTHP
jgi:cobalt-zinc-cadmium efflux system membrane fusion protein